MGLLTAAPEELFDVDTCPLFLGGEVKRLFPEAAVLPSAVRRRLFESAVERELTSEGQEDADEEQLDLGQENRFELKEVLVPVPAAESTLPENIFELAKVLAEEEFEE